MIQADDGAYYTGVTTDVERRFREHSDGARGRVRSVTGVQGLRLGAMSHSVCPPRFGGAAV